MNLISEKPQFEEFREILDYYNNKMKPCVVIYTLNLTQQSLAH
jgi:hypothetical protein